jgi:hypothetical protein
MLKCYEFKHGTSVGMAWRQQNELNRKTGQGIRSADWRTERVGVRTI